MNFGADESMFEILVNNRQTMRKAYEMLGITDEAVVTKITRLNDKKDKIEEVEYLTELQKIVRDTDLTREIKTMIESEDAGDSAVVAGLKELGIENVRLDRSLARGFDYYTGTIFEIKDTAEGNNRSLLGGGRYDNLTGLFGGEPITGIGFGFGDVTMKDFLESHDLMSTNITSPTVMIIPTGPAMNLAAQKVAQQFRTAGIATATDIGTKKIGKKIALAGEQLVDYAVIVGENEIAAGQYALKNLAEETEQTGTIEKLLHFIKE
jgi:histidyl-tRNA synthetase